MKTSQILIAASAMACALVASADTLYWQVATQDKPFTYAQVYATETYGGAGTAISGAAAMADGVTTANGTGNTVSPVISDISGYGSSYYFYVELVNNSTGVAESWSMNKDYPWSYNQLLSSGYISTGSSMKTPFVGGALNGGAVPEPTSGLLMLIGGSLLALRRRRQS